ncbi:hypothetical protein FVEG_14804 [Fusarium verticillioides 7600]|uniref:Uncharacterized protein n=1 Tax=Gibberella moniliformis (strain M3125 / FGSC 7600) TaxID=334819 RepID=W7LH40_GIBM7|nr:hypothetical protein FVEG_14804 [Fusarium verticillioides 7600]EWG37851.1 hypothetical protein FVEG_14804 [Fusarium verticillioides 7600]
MVHKLCRWEARSLATAQVSQYGKSEYCTRYKPKVPDTGMRWCCC